METLKTFMHRMRSADRSLWADHIVAFMALFASGFCCLIAEFSVGKAVGYHIGDTAVATTVIIGFFMGAMALSTMFNWLIRPKPGDDAVTGRTLLTHFLMVEFLLCLLSASSVMLVAYFAEFMSPWVPAIILAVAIGSMIGFEIPLFMRFYETREPDLGKNLAVVVAADYFGSFAAGALYGLVLVPEFGIFWTSVSAGALNLLIGILVFWRFFPSPRRYIAGWMSATAAVLAVLMIMGPSVVLGAVQAQYRDTITLLLQSSVQQIVVTEKRETGGFYLYLNGGLQFCSTDERRYHEMLVHPAFVLKPDAKRVLVLGGGDGLAMREVLKYDSVQSATLVDLDPAMTDLARNHPRLSKLNAHALDDLRVTVVNDDAFVWIKSQIQVYDIIIIDFPDPRSEPVAKLYSHELFRQVRAHLSEDGAATIQSSSPVHAPGVFANIRKTLASAGLAPVPYRMYVPTFGDWGYHALMRSKHIFYQSEQMVRRTLKNRLDEMYRRLEHANVRVPTEVVNQAIIQASLRFEKGILDQEAEISTTNDPTVHAAYGKAWEQHPW